MKPLRIFVSGPYSADTAEKREANTQRAIDAGIAIIHRGHHAYIPHLTHYLDIRATAIGQPLGYEDYMRLDLEWLHFCDALLTIGSSPGADRELQFAERNGLIIYRSVWDVPVV